MTLSLWIGSVNLFSLNDRDVCLFRVSNEKLYFFRTYVEIVRASVRLKMVDSSSVRVRANGEPTS